MDVRRAWLCLTVPVLVHLTGLGCQMPTVWDAYVYKFFRDLMGGHDTLFPMSSSLVGETVHSENLLFKV